MKKQMFAQLKNWKLLNCLLLLTDYCQRRSLMIDQIMKKNTAFKNQQVKKARRLARKASPNDFCATKIKNATKEFRNCAVPTAQAKGYQSGSD